jgi:hypothetical protein
MYDSHTWSALCTDDPHAARMIKNIQFSYDCGVARKWFARVTCSIRTAHVQTSQKHYVLYGMATANKFAEPVRAKTRTAGCKTSFTGPNPSLGVYPELMTEHLGPRLQYRLEHQHGYTFANVNCLFRKCTFIHFRYLQLWHVFPLNCSGNYCLFVTSYVVRSKDFDTLSAWCLSFHIFNWYLALSPKFANILILFHWLI